MLEIALMAAFVGGLAGGLHCAGMCGGIVRVLCAAPGAGAPPQWPHLLAYNGGRIFSYVVAGTLAGAIGEAGLLTRAAPMLQPLMFFLASLMLTALGLYLTGLAPVVSRIEAVGARLWRLVQPWTGRMLPVTSAIAVMNRLPKE